jgi:5-methylcytosine-specific restriction enzyme subunit McrC
MIKLSEQYGYPNPKAIDDIDTYRELLDNKSYSKSIQRGQDKAYCFSILHNENDESLYRFETSYFVGVDWIIENKLPIYVRPKLDDSNQEVDYLKMLFTSLNEPQNFNHLDQLCEIDFDKPAISITQSQDLLTPLLLIQFLNVLKKIVQKGLKKSYYQVTKNLNAKVKGKILINQTIRKNHFKGNTFHSYCQYNEFGVNSLENKVLKKALLFSVSAIQNLKGLETSALQSIINYINPAFTNVDSDVDIRLLKNNKPNALYKEYGIAIKLAKMILKKYGYNISNATSEVITTPPFWIDMSKLFELYVYAKLKERFSQHGEVTYHKKFNYLEPDFIVKSHDGSTEMVIDAKYKPRYENHNISTEDIRQISGYARLKKVYDFLSYVDEKVIDCLVIYSHKNSVRKDFIGENFKLTVEPEYNKFYKIDIQLPMKSKSA